jgi:hypothetical protein
MTLPTCIAERVPAEYCPCAQCRKVMEAARRIAAEYARAMADLAQSSLRRQVQ